MVSTGEKFYIYFFKAGFSKTDLRTLSLITSYPLRGTVLNY